MTQPQLGLGGICRTRFTGGVFLVDGLWPALQVDNMRGHSHPVASSFIFRRESWAAAWTSRWKLRPAAFPRCSWHEHRREGAVVHVGPLTQRTCHRRDLPAEIWARTDTDRGSAPLRPPPFSWR